MLRVQVVTFCSCSRLLDSTGAPPHTQQDGEGPIQAPPTQPYSWYDLDDLDVSWLQLVNHEFRQMCEYTPANVLSVSWQRTR